MCPQQGVSCAPVDQGHLCTWVTIWTSRGIPRARPSPRPEVSQDVCFSAWQTLGHPRWNFQTVCRSHLILSNNQLCDQKVTTWFYKTSKLHPNCRWNFEAGWLMAAPQVILHRTKAQGGLARQQAVYPTVPPNRPVSERAWASSCTQSTHSQVPANEQPCLENFFYRCL